MEKAVITNRLQFSGALTNGTRLNIDLELRGKVTVIDGYSGVGKSLFVSLLKWYKQDTSDDLAKKILVYDVSASSDTLTLAIKDGVSALFIIDNAETLLTPDNIELIRQDTRAQYIIIGREDYDLWVSPNCYATLVQEGTNLKLKYSFSLKGWM